MQIGLFFGTFNPVHTGHMVLANYMREFTELDEVWFVVSPHSPFKEKAAMLPQQDRLNLVNLALEDQPGFRSSSIEFGMPQPSYTVHTLARLAEKFPMHRFSLIMGQDNLQGLHKWKNHEQILGGHRIYVYPRPGSPASPFDNHPAVTMTQAPVMEISSTFIRQSIRDGKDMRFFLPGKVWEEIDTMNFYRR
jgi:nicotinate-nucleotide adenylyltransferase